MRAAAAILLVLVSLPAPAQERLLVPVAYNGPGAFGSFWTTLVGVYNPAPMPWRFPGLSFIHFNCPIPEGCTTGELPPAGAAQIVREGSLGFDAPGGFFIHLPPRELVSWPHFFARFGSQPGVEFGAELPLPTDRDFNEFSLFFPLITTGVAPVRTLLRIYELTGQRDVVVRIFVRPIFQPGAEPRTLDVVVRPQQPPGTDPVLLPGFAQVSLTEAFGQTFGLADIVIQQRAASGPLTPAKLWAFITVTHTETHQVGVFTPRGFVIR